MKRMIGRMVLSQEFQLSIAGALLRQFVRATHGTFGYSPEFRLDTQAIERPHYAYCMMRAAELAKMLGLSRISAIEIGVAGGNGLKFMCDFAKEVETATGVAVDCYGFDTGAGMPPPEGSKDLPFWFQAAQYEMDEPALRRKAPDGKLVIGNVKDTIPGFLAETKPAPIGAIFNDTDYFSSTRDSFALFDGVADHPDCFLPRIFMYFDDIIGRDVEMYGPFNGQLAALNDYNDAQSDVKIHLNQNLMPKLHLSYRWQIYYAHLFNHPRYDEYIGGTRQDAMEDALKLR